MNEKAKKHLIGISIAIVILAGTFSAGYAIGFGRHLARAESNSGKLEQRITDGINTAGNIVDRSNTAGTIADGIASNGRVITEGVGTMQLSTERLELFWTEVVRAVEADQKATDDFKSIHRGSSGAAIDALDIAIQHSEQYEELISSLQRAIDNLNEDN